VILASNLKDNIDQAFMRRFQSVIHFPMPGAEERLKIWKNAFSKDLRPDKNVDLETIAAKYELSGGMMMNVIRYCTLKALRDKRKTIRQEDIETGVRRELLKDGIWLA
jgi:ATP-dependent 26S proteasome regulatory subunit